MLDFFIALFGGLYYGGRYLGEKTSARRYDMEAAARRALRKHIQNTYCVDREETLGVRSYVHTNMDKVCEEFKEELIYAIGNDFKSEINKPIPPDCIGWDWPGNPKVWIYKLVLASRGKIDEDLFWSGYPIGGLRYEYRERNIRFAEMIEKKLVEAGVPDIKLVMPESDGLHLQIESLCIGKYKRLW